MPELPEAETIVRGLRPLLVDRTVASVRVVKPDVLRASPRAFATRVRDRTFSAVGRRGKNVLLHLHDGGVVAVNLGMTGRLLPFEGPRPDPARSTHPAVRFRLVGGGELVFDDVRRFGTVEALDGAEWAERSSRMGPEPLAREYSARDLARGLSASKAPARSWLLDQKRIAGVGNIYANEALFLAGIHPQRRACDVEPERARRLHRSLRRVLRDAIRAGGTTIRDYRDASGGKGQFARRLLVYGRDGETCHRCPATVRRVVFGGRSAFHCPQCQFGP